MMSSRTLAEVLMELSQKYNNEEAFTIFMNYVKKNNLVSFLPQICKHLQHIHRQQSENTTLYITSAYELSDAIINHIKKVAGAENAPVIQRNDDTLIGGFRATYNGYMYNGSLDHQVNRLRSLLTT